MSARILLCGYYGLGNAGDEAVLAASTSVFRARNPALRLAALSADPAGTAANFGIDTVPRMRPAALRAIRNCDLFLSGGGSLLQDRTSLKSLIYYLFLLNYARRAGKRTMVFAQGIGPLIRPAARRWTARVLSRVDAITVRDAESADLLREIGVAGPEIEVTADPVFALEPQVTERVTAVALQRPVVAVSLRPRLPVKSHSTRGRCSRNRTPPCAKRWPRASPRSRCCAAPSRPGNGWLLPAGPTWWWACGSTR